MNAHRWIVPPARARRAATLRLYCFHHAGGSASSFAAWQRALPDWIDVFAVALPRGYLNGNEACASALTVCAGSDPPNAQLTRWVEGISAALARPGDECAFAFYGHSLGALVAYELTCARRRAGATMPLALCVSGRRAPPCPLRGEPLCTLDDAALIDVLEGMGGVEPGMLRRDKWRAVLLPTLRDDLRASDLYVPRREPPLDIPVFVFRGRDDPILAADEANAWCGMTRATTASRALSGSHFFDAAGVSDLQRHLTNDLQALMTRTMEAAR